MVKDISNNQYGYAPAIKDYKQIRQLVQQQEQQVESIDKKLSFAALEALPPFRRISSLPQKFENNEYLSALGLAGLAFMNLPEDWRDIKKATQQVNDKILPNSTKEYLKKNNNKFFKNFVEYNELYDRKNHQHSFSFFRGTILEKTLTDKANAGAVWANELLELDKSIYKTKLGGFMDKNFGITVIGKQKTNITSKIGKKAWASQFGGGFAKEMTGRAMKRIPILSVVALALIELPKVFKAQKDGNNLFQKTDEIAKQTVKSGINVTSILAGVGYGGAIGAKYGKAFGSLVGMGVGAIIGSEGSKRLQELVG